MRHLQQYDSLGGVLVKGGIYQIDVNRLVWERWRDLANNDPNKEAIVHWVAGEEPTRWKWGQLFKKSMEIAQYLHTAGVKKGDVCALIIRHNKYFYPIYFAISALGALPSVLAYPNPRLHPEKFRQGLAGMAQRSGLDWFLTEKDLQEVIEPLYAKHKNTIKGTIYPLDCIEEETAKQLFADHPMTDPEEPCLLQHSSGTTGLQKAVVLSNRAILEHVARYGEAIQITPNDKIISWLPLYHDMGLIAAFYLPLTLGIPVVQLDPFEWVVAPVILLEAISKENGTISWLPNFAYNLMADRIREEDLQGIRLDDIRMLINCSEPVRSESHDKFFKRYKRYGLKRESLGACYAMAETTFAATQTPPGKEARKVFVKREEIMKGKVEISNIQDGARISVSSGFPISGCELKIVGESGEDLPTGYVGEVAIRSVSLFNEYRNNPEITDEVLKNGWYFSGDYGFIYEGEYYIIARKKDILIVAGNNIYPEDVEDAVSQVKGVFPGRVIAFGIEDEISGTELICVVAETNFNDSEEQKKLRQDIIKAGMEIDVTISRVYIAPPRWLIKSSSGKPSRKANMERAINELAWR
jgi:acyl-CoA synthetase (AMP-forming)/AMP-acid ligase II